MTHKLEFWRRIASKNSVVPKWIEFGYPLEFRNEIPPARTFNNHTGARVQYIEETKALLKEYEE